MYVFITNNDWPVWLNAFYVTFSITEQGVTTISHHSPCVQHKHDKIHSSSYTPNRFSINTPINLPSLCCTSTKIHVLGGENAESMHFTFNINVKKNVNSTDLLIIQTP